MAPKKGKETALDLCSQATALGNTISVRMLEYLGSGTNEPHNFRQLANDFREICGTLWSIEAGLLQVSRNPAKFPAELLEELAKKIRLVSEDFSVLNQLLVRFLDGEKKGGFRKLRRMMFADTDIENMRRSLLKNQEALKMSALMFKWSVGERRIDSTNSSMSIGYTALSAALGHVNGNESRELTPPPATIPTSPVNSTYPPQRLPHPGSLTPGSRPPELPLPPPRGPLMDRAITPTSLKSLHDSRHDSKLDDSTVMSLHRRQSQGNGHFSDSSRTTASPVMQKPIHPESRDAHGGSVSEATVAMTAIEDLIHDMDLKEYRYKMPMVREHEMDDTESVALGTDFPAPPPRNPRHGPDMDVPLTKMSLKIAIQQHQHRIVEYLLARGIPADDGLDVEALRLALAKKDGDSVRLLLQYGADPNSIDQDGLTPLHSASQSSFLRGAELLIGNGADPNLAPSPDTDSPLATAVTDARFDFVQLYLQHGGSVASPMANGDTILVKAMNKTTPTQLLDLMLTHGANPNGKNGEGVSPLFAAIQSSRLDLITMLLERGADPNLPGPKHPLWPSTYQPKVLQLLLSQGASSKKTPGVMELATSINNIESVAILLKAGVDPNTRKDGTYTPLCSAIRDNRAEMVSLLLANGADANVMASEYPAFKCVTHHRSHFLPQLVAAGADLNSPKGIVEKAVAHDNRDALKWLLKQGVSPNDRSPEGCTPLTTAIRDEKLDIIDMLLAHGANPALRGQEWPISMSVKQPKVLAKLLPHVKSPAAIPKGVLEMAVVAGSLDSIKLLLAAGVSVEDKNGGVFSPLTTALREHQKEIALYLLDEAGADPNAPGEHLPIIKAIRRCDHDLEYISMLLERGADINLFYRGWNAVLQAVENGDADILRLLVQKGGKVDLDATDENGRTVMEIVEGRGWAEAVDILLEAREEPVGVAS